MTKDDIISTPHPDLRRTSQRVGLITDDIKQKVRAMIDATLDWEASRQHEVGVALAAVQVDELLRIIVIRNDFDNKNDQTFHCFINPEITKFEGEQIEDFEGCLSVPDIYGKVKRYRKVRVTALDLEGKKHRFTAEDFLARVFQHEIDHTKGKLFIDHIKDKKDAFYKLNTEGHLEPLDYDQAIKDNDDLWA